MRGRMSVSDPVLSEEKNAPSCWLKGAYLFVVAILIVSLSGTAIAAAIWFYQEYAAVESAVISPAVPPSFPQIEAIEPSVAPARIAFINEEGQVETVDQDGKNGRLLTDTKKQYRFPAWSANGRIAVLSQYGIYQLQDEEKGEIVELYEHAIEVPIYLYWLPDGERLGFLAAVDGDDLALYIAESGGGAPFLQTTASPLYWDWSPMGEQIFLHGNGTGAGSRLSLMETGAGGDGVVVAQPGSFQAPDFSTDGRYLAYAEERTGGQSWLVISDLEPPTLTPHTIESQHAGLVAMGWSPTANQLATISGEYRGDGFHGALHLLDVDSGEDWLLSSREVGAFFWSPNGRYLATLTVSRFNDDIYARSTSGRVGQMRQKDDPVTLQLSLIEVESGQRHSLTSFQPTDIFLYQFLPYFDQYAHSHQLWSPNNDAIVLPMLIDGEERVVVVGIDGRVEVVGNGRMPVFSSQ